MRLFKTYVQVFTLQSAGARLCTSNLGFMVKDRATLKEVQEQVAKLACSNCIRKEISHTIKSSFLCYIKLVACSVLLSFQVSKRILA